MNAKDGETPSPAAILVHTVFKLAGELQTIFIKKSSARTLPESIAIRKVVDNIVVEYKRLYSAMDEVWNPDKGDIYAVTNDMAVVTKALTTKLKAILEILMEYEKASSEKKKNSRSDYDNMLAVENDELKLFLENVPSNDRIIAPFVPNAGSKKIVHAAVVTPSSSGGAGSRVFNFFLCGGSKEVEDDATNFHLPQKGGQDSGASDTESTNSSSGDDYSDSEDTDLTTPNSSGEDYDEQPEDDKEEEEEEEEKGEEEEEEKEEEKKQKEKEKDAELDKEQKRKEEGPKVVDSNVSAGKKDKKKKKKKTMSFSFGGKKKGKEKKKAKINAAKVKVEKEKEKKEQIFEAVEGLSF